MTFHFTFVVFQHSCIDQLLQIRVVDHADNVSIVFSFFVCDGKSAPVVCTQN